MSDTPVIEAMLLRWSESHNGRTVTLQLPPDGEHPFRGLPCGPTNGARLAIAIARIADDETTVPVEPPSQPSEKPTGGGNGNGAGKHRLSQQAALCCQDARFKAFLMEKSQGEMHYRNGEWDIPATVRALCYVSSRADLDTDPAAAERWRTLHSRYIAWREAP